MTPKREGWVAAFSRILAETHADLPDEADADVYDEYRQRCEQWKRERGYR